jgi:protein-tyrosine-phosphatase
MVLQMSKRVLVLCYANRWRSPLTAALLARDGFLVKSAGFTKPGQGAGLPVRKVAKTLGVDLEGHRSQLVTQELVNWAELVVLMNLSHVDRLTRTYPKPARQAWVRLGQYADPRVDSIPDLAFLQGKAFDDTVALIQVATANLSKELQNAE